MAKIVNSRKLTEEEMLVLNTKIIKVGPQYRLIGGSVSMYDDGRNVATFATMASHVTVANATIIGELMLSLMDNIDEVHHDCRIVAVRK